MADEAFAAAVREPTLRVPGHTMAKVDADQVLADLAQAACSMLTGLVGWGYSV